MNKNKNRKGEKKQEKQEKLNHWSPKSMTYSERGQNKWIKRMISTKSKSQVSQSFWWAFEFQRNKNKFKANQVRWNEKFIHVYQWNRFSKLKSWPFWCPHKQLQQATNNRFRWKLIKYNICISWRLFSIWIEQIDTETNCFASVKITNFFEIIHQSHLKLRDNISFRCTTELCLLLFTFCAKNTIKRMTNDSHSRFSIKQLQF